MLTGAVCRLHTSFLCITNINTILDELERRAEIGVRRKRRERKERGERWRGERWRGEMTRQSHGTHTHGWNLYMYSL